MKPNFYGSRSANSARASRQGRGTPLEGLPHTPLVVVMSLQYRRPFNVMVSRQEQELSPRSSIAHGRFRPRLHLGANESHGWPSISKRHGLCCRDDPSAFFSIDPAFAPRLLNQPGCLHQQCYPHISTHHLTVLSTKPRRLAGSHFDQPAFCSDEILAYARQCAPMQQFGE